MPTNPWDYRWERIAIGSSGAQGLTFLVRDRDSSREAIMKILRQNRVKDAKSRQRMHLEVTSLTVLSQAGADVPNVLDSNTSQFADESVQLYFVMDRIDGSTLADYVKKNGPMSLSNAISLVTALCKTLRIAFDRELGHRDIKPENIILRQDNVRSPVMVDFGLTFNSDIKNITQLDDGFDNQFVSLPERRTPGDNRRDPRSDITGVSAVLFYCLTAHAPHVLQDSKGRAPHRRSIGMLSGSIGSERQLRLLNALFDRSFSYELAMRIQSLDELASRLAEISSDSSNSIHESLEAVAARNHGMLLASDRTTRLSIYRKAAERIRKRFDDAVQIVDSKLADYPRFMRSAKIGHFNLPEPPFGTEQLADGRIFTVRVQGHAPRYSVSYALHAAGDEAVLARIVFRQGPEDKNLFKSPNRASDITIISEWEAIDRYAANLEPPEGIVERDFEMQMVSMIDMLCREISSLSNRASE